jgi:hypothetical protein
MIIATYAPAPAGTALQRPEIGLRNLPAARPLDWHEVALRDSTPRETPFSLADAPGFYGLSSNG